MMSRLRVSLGVVWVLWPLGLLGIELYMLASIGFEDWPRWVPFFLLLLFISACGIYFSFGWPGAKWVLSVVALAVGLYFGLIAMLAGGNDPQGSFQWGNAAVPLAGVGFAVFSIGVAHCS